MPLVKQQQKTPEMNKNNVLDKEDVCVAAATGDLKWEERHRMYVGGGCRRTWSNVHIGIAI